MNQDSEDDLTERQRAKRAKVLASGTDDRDKPEFQPVIEYFYDPVYEEKDTARIWAWIISSLGVYKLADQSFYFSGSID